MKLIWSPETASKAYLETVKSLSQCNEKVKESGVSELVAAMAGGWNAKLIVEAYQRGGAIAASVGLAVAARHTCGRHVCLVSDHRTAAEFSAAFLAAAAAAAPPEVIVGDAEAAMAGLEGVDFLVVDCRRKDFARVLRSARVSSRGAVFAAKNAWHQRSVSGFRWNSALVRGTRVVRSVFLPVGKGLDVAHIGGGSGPGRAVIGRRPSRWITRVDQRSGEEHVFRERLIE